MQTAGSLLVRPMPGGERQVTGKNGCGRPDRMAGHTKSHARSCGQPQWPDVNRPMQPGSMARHARHSMGPCRTEKGRRQKLVVDQPVFPPAPPPAKQPPSKRWRRHVGTPHGLLQHPALKRCTAHGRRDRRGVEPQMTDTQRIEAVEKPLHPQTPRLLRKNSPIDLFPAPVQELPPVGQVAQAEPCRGEMHGGMPQQMERPELRRGQQHPLPADIDRFRARHCQAFQQRFEPHIRGMGPRIEKAGVVLNRHPADPEGRVVAVEGTFRGGRTAPQGNGPLRAGGRKTRHRHRRTDEEPARDRAGSIRSP